MSSISASRLREDKRPWRSRYFDLGVALTALWGAACLCSSEDAEGLAPPPRPVLEQPKGLAAVRFKESERGDALVLGCADGQREGFADPQVFPNVAGCLGKWTGQLSLRAAATGKPCGDDLGTCAVPADVCATGWHVCAASGKADDLHARVGAQECGKQAGPGKFVAAMSHGQVQEICPPAPSPTTTFPCWGTGICAEPVCCGDLCEFGMCKDSVWAGQTRISRGTAEGCANVRSANNGGVLCCRDEIVAKASVATPATTATTGSTSADLPNTAASSAASSKAGPN